MRISAGGRDHVLKRTSRAQDWIARATDDIHLREARFAAIVAGESSTLAGRPVVAPHLGAAIDGDEAAILMPDLSGRLLSWEVPIDEATLERLLGALATLHAGGGPAGVVELVPPCPLDRRLLLLSEPAARSYASQDAAVGPYYLAGWDAFRRLAPRQAVALVDSLAMDVAPLVAALAELPPAPLHADLKLSNMAVLGDTSVAIIDWQMLLRAPVAVELAWFLVANSLSLPLAPDEVLRRYRRQAVASHVPLGDWDAQTDLVAVCGLLLRGWRKAADVVTGRILPSGVTAADDLEWWCSRAVDGSRRLDARP